MSSVGASLDVVWGEVTAYDERVQSVRVNQTTGYGQVHATPELWIRDNKGQEHRYQGELFRSARVGHQVAVISDRVSRKTIAFANLTTQIVHDAPELSAQKTPTAILFHTFGVSLLLAIPGLFAWFSLLDTVGLADSALSGWGFKAYIFLLPICVFSGVMIWSRRQDERTEQLKVQISRVLQSDTASVPADKLL